MTRPILHAVTGKNRFCGPTAIATITGLSTDEASQAVRAVTGKRQTTGVHRMDLAYTLRNLGYYAEVQDVQGKPTAVRWAREHRDLYRDQYVVLIHGNHYGTLAGSRFLCSLSKRETVSVSDIPKARGRVSGYLVVRKAGGAA